LASPSTCSSALNFLVGEIGISGLQAGLLEAVRESCGIPAAAASILIVLRLPSGSGDLR
jgi:hypothetical protein